MKSRPTVKSISLIFNFHYMPDVVNDADHLLFQFVQLVSRPNYQLSEVLDAFFSFLRRRSDFFHQSIDGDIGFPPGEAQRLLLEVFNKHNRLYQEHNKRTTVQENGVRGVQEPGVNRPSQPITVIGCDWSQTSDTLNIEIHLSAAASKRDLQVTGSSQFIILRTPESKTILESQLLYPIDESQTVWWIDNSTICFELVKQVSQLWNKLFVTDRESVDLSKVKSEVLYTDLDSNLKENIRRTIAQHDPTRSQLPP